MIIIGRSRLGFQERPPSFASQSSKFAWRKRNAQGHEASIEIQRPNFNPPNLQFDIYPILLPTHPPQNSQFNSPPSLTNPTMAPKRNTREPTPSALSQTSTTTAGSTPVATRAPMKSSNNQSPAEIALGIWKNYLDTTPQRTKLIDVFMAFLVTVGVLQFVYCVIAGNYVGEI